MQNLTAHFGDSQYFFGRYRYEKRHLVNFGGKILCRTFYSYYFQHEAFNVRKSSGSKKDAPFNYAARIYHQISGSSLLKELMRFFNAL